MEMLKASTSESNKKNSNTSYTRLNVTSRSIQAIRKTPGSFFVINVRARWFQTCLCHIYE